MKSYVLFVLLLPAFMLTQAQNTMYFMEHMPQKQLLNPALIPEVDFYLFLPGINGVSVQAANSGFNYDELDNFLNNLGDPGYDPDEFIGSMGESNRFSSTVHASVFGFGFKIKEKAFFSFNATSHHFLLVDARPEVVYLLTDYDDIREIRFPVVIEGVDFSTNNYLDLGINYVHKITDHLTVAINPAIRNSYFGMATRDLRYVIDLESKDEYGYKSYKETFEGEAVIGLPTPLNPEAVSGGELDMDKGLLAEGWSEEMQFSDLFSNAHFSVNLGANCQIDKWNLSASLLNLSFSRWKKNGYRLSGNEEVVRVYEEEVDIAVPRKIYLGAMRQFSPRWNYGIMLENAFYRSKTLSSATVSLNGAVGRMLSTSFSYTTGYNYDNFGLGLRLRFFPGMDLYVVTDNLLQAFNYRKSYSLSGAAGINFSTGIKNHLLPTKRNSRTSTAE